MKEERERGGNREKEERKKYKGKFVNSHNFFLKMGGFVVSQTRGVVYVIMPNLRGGHTLTYLFLMSRLIFFP